MDLSLPRFEQRLPTLDSESSKIAPGKRHAAVAALLRYERDAPDVLLMQRAVVQGDRWSGQVSFPGGRSEQGDGTLLDTAVRETLEEVGVDLAASARPVGRLPTVRAVAKGKMLPMTISPFVFVQTSPVEISLNHEATHAFWLPLDRAAAGDFDATYTYELGTFRKQFPCWNYEGHTIWGMTFGMLNGLLERVR